MADMVLLSIGVKPRTELAVSAGAELGKKGIKVDEYLETTVKDIYAVGDAIEFTHPITGQPWLNYLAGPANRQGRIVAENMCRGNSVKYEGAIGTSIAKVFDLSVASTGTAAKTLKREGLPYATSVTHSSSYAGYYPGSTQLTLKIVFNPENGKLLGVQGVGYQGVDKRIDVAASVIKRGGTLDDLIKMEQAYAPPYSSAKDPLAIAGYAAKNIMTGEMRVISWRQFQALDKSEVFLLDVRTEQEFAIRSIEGFKNIPVDELRERIDEVPKDRPIILTCAIGLRGYVAQRILVGRGYKDVRNLSGGVKHYKTATEPHGSQIETAKFLIENNDAQLPYRPDAVKTASPLIDLELDACGLSCPGPILKLKETMDTMLPGQKLRVKATDIGFWTDSESWSKSTGNKIISRSQDKGVISVVMQKGGGAPAASAGGGGRNKTFIMFSDDLDKALATFVLANGAAATGHKVTIFFTFWGLNVIKKTNKPKVAKDIFGKMFGFMLPSDSRGLHLSKMSMFGIGDRLMRRIMKRKNIASLEELRSQAILSGVEFIACQMSMDVMGVKKEELLDNVKVGGVATYMSAAEESGVNLFI